VNYFLTAIGTDSGKTVISSIITQALNADYWKPIQAGYPTDSDTVRSLTNGRVSIHTEGVILKKPASPHDAAKEEGINLNVEQLSLPSSKKDIIIEGAGGILVPLNDKEYVIDLATHFNAEVILVSNLYLGSINHTLLTLEAIKRRSLQLKGIVFNGKSNRESEDIILKKANAPVLLKVGQENKINIDIVKKYAEKFRSRWDELGF